MNGGLMMFNEWFFVGMNHRSWGYTALIFGSRPGTMGITAPWKGLRINNAKMKQENVHV